MAIPYTFHSKLVLRNPSVGLKTTIGHLSLADFIKDKFFLEALFLASPVLHSELLKFTEGRITDVKAIEKLHFSVAKYYLRMCSRSTPFGLFSGCSVADWHTGNTKLIIDNKAIERHTRFDMHYLCALGQHLAKLPFIKEQLLYFANSSCYTIGDEIRYIEYKYINAKRSHAINTVLQTDYLKKVMDHAKQGVYFKDIVALLVNDEISEQEASEFTSELIDAQLLVNEMEPAITGDEFLQQLIAVLKKINNVPETPLEKIIAVLENLDKLLQQIDAAGNNDLAAYKNIMQCLQQLGVVYEESKLFQTDICFSSIQNKVSTIIQDQLNEVLNVINQFSPGYHNPNLQSFVKRFYDRYEDKEMPLLEVLDVETGIGYLDNNVADVVPLVQDIQLPFNREEDDTVKFGPREKMLLKKLKIAHSEGLNTIEITNEDLADFKGSWDNLPLSIPVMYRLLGNNKIQMEITGGSSAANILGRFAHASEPIRQLVNEITEAEQLINPDVILAEIVHLPESRIGNVLLHPAFRKYEIPFLAKSSVDADHQVHLQDLFISIKGGKVILRSKKLNKQIIPRLSSSHNYSFNALPVYQFLCEVQVQEKKGGLNFYWGILENYYNVLPRVSYKNVVISPAQWNLYKKDIDQLYKKEDEELLLLVKTFTQKWQLPQYVVLADGDNELLINFKDPLMIRIWLDAVKNRQILILKEFITPENNETVTNAEGEIFNNQFIAVLVKNADNTSAGAVPPVNSNTIHSHVTQNFALGSEWLYYKIYCGAKSADKILELAIAPLVKELQEQKIINGFFFIRYNDPDFHLRLRFKLTDTVNIGKIISLFQQHISCPELNGLTWKIQTDTYKRELTRYGNNTIELAEELFYYDSLAVMQMLSLTEGEEREQVRWIWAIRSIDQLLNDFNFSIADKYAMATQLKNAFHNEFKTDKILKEQLNTKYRTNRKAIEQILEQARDDNNRLLPLINILKTRSINNQPVTRALLEKRDKNQLERHMADLLSSYIHMLVNRVVTSNPRLHELLLYDILFNYYRAVIEKNKQKENKPNAVAA